MADRQSPSLVTITFLGFISLSLPDGMLGVAWPSMRLSYGQPIGALGVLVFASTAAYLLSSVLNGALLRRLALSKALAASSVLVAAGLALLTAGAFGSSRSPGPLRWGLAPGQSMPG
jgi:hypothetical protein